MPIKNHAKSKITLYEHNKINYTKTSTRAKWQYIHARSIRQGEIIVNKKNCFLSFINGNVSKNDTSNMKKIMNIVLDRNGELPNSKH